jgi:folate-binding protein YgfZ
VPIALPSPQVLEIAGADAVAFAHAQFASDVRALANRQWQWSAWLSAQGRVRAFFRVLRIGDERLLLILQGGVAETLRAALAPFVFRAKVQLQGVETWQAIGFEQLGDLLDYLGAVPGATDVVVAGDRIGTALPGPQPRWYVLGDVAPAAVGTSPAALNHWNAADVAAGIVEIGDAQADRFLPSWLGLDELGAVSVRKGCYPGQEIVARLHFKGGNKRWLQQLAFRADAMPAAGMALAADHDAGGPGGELLRAAWTEAGQGVALAALPKLPAGAALRAPALPGASFRVVSTIDSPSD